MVYLKAEGHDSVWVYSLLKTVVFNCDKGIYFSIRGDDEGAAPIVRWMSEAKLLFETGYASWKGNERYNTMPRLEMKIFGAATDGATVYFNMRDIQAGCVFTGTAAKSGRWCNKMSCSWLKVLNSCNLSAAHLYVPSIGHSVETLRLDGVHCSSFALPHHIGALCVRVEKRRRPTAVPPHALRDCSGAVRRLRDDDPASRACNTRGAGLIWR